MPSEALPSLHSPLLLGAALLSTTLIVALLIVLMIVRKAHAADLPQVLNGISNIILALSALLPWSRGRVSATSSVTSTTAHTSTLQVEGAPADVDGLLGAQQPSSASEGSS
ncbi:MULTISPECIES: hypothetical protein [Streptomyces]|uniref:hypothetical protein n=1 Tax=Streptomyces TaxID=1883 RepID=UPI000FFEC706|nr:MULTISPECIES: hypothetical protein [Streptomyces]